jgi:hypothetical protein
MLIVQIATNQLDGQGNAPPPRDDQQHPLRRGQSGTNSFTATPVVDDLGVMVVSDRDISAVQSGKAIDGDAESLAGNWLEHDDLHQLTAVPPVI